MFGGYWGKREKLKVVLKNLTANAGEVIDEGSILGSGRFPGGGHGNPLLVFLPGESHGHRSLAGYNP